MSSSSTQFSHNLALLPTEKLDMITALCIVWDNFHDLTLKDCKDEFSMKDYQTSILNFIIKPLDLIQPRIKPDFSSLLKSHYQPMVFLCFFSFSFKPAVSKSTDFYFVSWNSGVFFSYTNTLVPHNFIFFSKWFKGTSILVLLLMKLVIPN